MPSVFSLPRATAWHPCLPNRQCREEFKLTPLQERRRQQELPGLLARLAGLGRGEAGAGGTLGRYNKEESYYDGAGIRDSRDLSTSTPVLLQLYDHVKVITVNSLLLRPPRSGDQQPRGFSQFTIGI